MVFYPVNTFLNRKAKSGVRKVVETELVTFKKSIVKYIYYKVDEIISTYRVYVMFQYFVIYFNKIIQDMI